jgi:hypothetical protein
MFIAALCSIAIGLSLPAVALGAGTANCSEGAATNRWRGVSVQDANQKHGVSGTAESHILAQCNNPGLIEFSGSFIFSNIVPAGGGFNDIVQIGMGNCRAPNCPGGMRYYSGWGRTSTTPNCGTFSNRAPTATDEGAYVAAAHDFKVYHQNNSWRFFVGLAEVGSVGEASICWTPKVAVWFGESWDFGDQIGGTLADKMSVTSMNTANVENGGFTFTNLNAANACNYGGAGAPFFCDITGARSYDTWSNR